MEFKRLLMSCGKVLAGAYFLSLAYGAYEETNIAQKYKSNPIVGRYKSLKHKRINLENEILNVEDIEDNIGFNECLNDNAKGHLKGEMNKIKIDLRKKLGVIAPEYSMLLNHPEIIRYKKELNQNFCKMISMHLLPCDGE